MKYDIFAVGDNVADYYPEQKKIYAGGGAYNVAVISRRLGAKTAYYGAFGTDQNAKFLYDTLKKEQVAYPVNDIRKGRNAVSIIEKNDGISSVKGVDKGVYKNLSLNKAVLEIINNSKIVHTNIYSYFEDYLKKIEDKAIISFDFSHLRNKSYISEISKLVDIAFFSTPKIDENPQQFIDWAAEQGAEVVILTLAGEGVLMKYEDQLIKKEAHQTKLKDTLGAGDAFIAAFLNTIKDSKNYESALEAGLAQAAKNCQINGSLGVAALREEDIVLQNDIHQEF